MYLHPAMARDIVAERQAAIQYRAARLRQASHARGNVDLGRRLPFRQRGRP